MPVHPDNIDGERRERIRAQGRARQAKLAAKKRAQAATMLRPKARDLDEALVRSLLSTAQTEIIVAVVKGAVDGMRAAGFQDVKTMMRARCLDLRPFDKLPTPSAPTKTAEPETTPAATPVTPTDQHAHSSDRIADPTHH